MASQAVETHGAGAVVPLAYALPATRFSVWPYVRWGLIIWSLLGLAYLVFRHVVDARTGEIRPWLSYQVYVLSGGTGTTFSSVGQALEVWLNFAGFLCVFAAAISIKSTQQRCHLLAIGAGLLALKASASAFWAHALREGLTTLILGLQTAVFPAVALAIHVAEASAIGQNRRPLTHPKALLALAQVPGLLGIVCLAMPLGNPSGARATRAYWMDAMPLAVVAGIIGPLVSLGLTLCFRMTPARGVAHRLLVIHGIYLLALSASLAASYLGYL